MFYRRVGLYCFLFAGATDESKKLMQYKLVVNISKLSGIVCYFKQRSNSIFYYKAKN